MTEPEYKSKLMQEFIRRLRDQSLRFDVAKMKRRMEKALRANGYERKEARAIVAMTMDAAINPDAEEIARIKAKR